jgi:hypothetical protein
MAGYKQAGNEEFINATTFNKQIERQRQAYQGGDTSTMGVYTPSNIFPDNRSDILESAVLSMNLNDISIGSNENPDFQDGASMSNIKSRSMFDDLSEAIDQPNKKGPNLIAPDINNLNAPTTSNASIPEDRQNKGFGWRDERNDPSSPAATIGTYFSRHYNDTGDNNDVSKPVLGEAKSPESDVNINYDQS